MRQIKFKLLNIDRHLDWEAKIDYYFNTRVDTTIRSYSIADNIHAGLPLNQETDLANALPHMYPLKTINTIL